MFKIITKIFTITIFALSFLVFSASAQSYGSLQISITDPYICGGNIVGKVIGGNPPIVVTVELFDSNDNLVKTYTINNLDSINSYQVNKPDKDVPSGKYRVVSTAVDSLGNTGSETFIAEILPLSECSTLQIVRTRAGEFIKNNLVSIILASSATFSSIYFVIKNQKVHIER